MSVANLEHFGRIIQTIRSSGAEGEVAVWAFLLHVSEHYPELLTVNPPVELREQAAPIVASLTLPTTHLKLKPPGSGLFGTPGNPLWTALALVLIGLAFLFEASRIETYGVGWYQDVRLLLDVGLGTILVVVGSRSFLLTWRSRRPGSAL